MPPIVGYVLGINLKCSEIALSVRTCRTFACYGLDLKSPVCGEGWYRFRRLFSILAEAGGLIEGDSLAIAREARK